MLILFFIYTQALEFGTKDQIDPGVLYWPKSDWSVNPIQMDSNCAGDITDIVFTFNPSTTLASGVFVATFPQGFPDATMFISNINLIAGQDVSVTIPSVQLPSEKGEYGPVSIMTRSSESGNIIDFNKIFALIEISDKKSKAKANSLKISFKTSDSALITSEEFLVFNFSLTQDLWNHDLIRVEIDHHFVLKVEECYSQVSFIGGHSSSDPSLLECEYVESEGFLYIYGLSNDLIISEVSTTGSVDVSLLVGTFITPEAAYPASDFEWNISIFRYGTNTVVEQYTGKGPIIINGEIIIKYWKPSNKLSPSEIVSGLTTFMDLQFVLTHSVPKQGSFIIKFSGIDIKDTVWKSDQSQSTTSGSTDYLLVSPYIGGTCSLLSNQILCQDFYEDISPGTLTITTLTQFTGSSASISYIVTGNADNDLIDRFIEGYTITYAISVEQQLFSHFTVQFAEDNEGNYISDTMADVLMYVCIKLPVSLTDTDSFTIYLPINPSVEKDLTAGLAETTLKLRLLSSSTLLTAGYNFLTSSLISLSDPVVSSGKITMSLTGLTTDTTSTDYIYFFFSSDSGSSLPGITLPMSASNSATKYEAIINTTISKIIYKSAQVLTISPSSFGATASLLCTDQGVLGLPLTVNIFPPISYSLDIGSKLIVEVTFDDTIETDLGSGISGAYPVYSTIEKSSFTLVQDTVAKLQMSGLTSMSSTKSYSFAFPIGIITQDLNIEIRLYFLTNTRNDIEYDIMKDSISISGTSTGISFSDIVVNTVPQGSVSASDPKINQKFSLEISPLVSSGNYNSGYLGITVPQGFSLAAAEVFLTSDSGIISTVLYSFSSSNSDFNLNSVYFSLTSLISVSSVTPSITVQTFQAPGYSNEADISVFLAPSTSSGCIAYGTGSSITVQKGQMVAPALSPDTITARGASSLISSIQAILTISYKVSGGLQIILNTNWEINELTTVSIEGLYGSYTVTQFGNGYNIKGFNEIKSLTAVTITVDNLTPPETVGSSGIVDQISSFLNSDMDVIIEQWTDTNQDYCTVVQGSSSQGSKIYEVSVFPNAAGAKGVYLYLDFSLPHSIPATGILYISSAVGSYSGVGDQSENCWSTLQYSECKINEEFLMIVLAEKYVGGNEIQILLDAAFDLPDKAGLTNDGFAVRSVFNGIIIDFDSFIEFENSQKLDIKELDNGEFTMGQLPLKVDPTNEGELSLYSFSFSISTQVEMADSLLFSFPYEFDHFLGNANEKFQWGDPGSNYLNCSSRALSTILCKVDHWNLIISGFTKPLTANTLIDLNISHIRNPAYTGRIFNNIGLYLYNSTHIKAVKNDYAGITISKAGAKVQIKSIYTTVPKLQAFSNYILNFFLDWIQLIPGDYLIIQFPAQYKISMENENELKCSCTWSDQSPTSINRDEQAWNQDSGTCFVNEFNQVIWPIMDRKLFVQTDLVQFVLEGLKNPEWGYSRSLATNQGDPSVFGNYDSWIQKLEVLTYSGQYYRYTSKSYFYLHSGFLGFYSGGESAVVNNFNAKTLKNFITVIPGSQSVDVKISISSNYLRAKKLKFQARNHEKNEVQLEFSSNSDDFIVTRDKTSLYFRVSAPLNAPNSLNYIEWVLEEISLDGLVSPAYITPVKTLVEVYNENFLSFVVGVVNRVYMNADSLPISIQTSNPPNSEIIIALGLVDSSIKGVSFNPPALLFTPDTNILYFTIFVNNETFTGKVLTPVYVSFTVTGSDSEVYSKINPVSFEVEEKSSLFSTQISLLTFADLTQTSLALRIKLNTASLVYWMFGPSNLNFPSFDELLNMTVPLESQQFPFISLQSHEYLSSVDNTPKNGENWEVFQKRLYSQFLGTLWYDVIYVEAGITTDIINFNWLWADTSLTAYIWTDNKGGYYSNSTFTQSTLEKSPALELTIKFEEAVNTVYEPVVKNALALSIGILTDFFTNPSVKVSQFTWTFNTDRASPLSPSTLLSNMDDSIFSSNLQYAGISSKYSIESKVVVQSNFEIPEWLNEPDIVEIGEGFVKFNASVVGVGQICCVADGNGLMGNSFQVYLGVDKYNKKIPEVCLSVVNETVYEGDINGLEVGVEYTMGCVICSSYPVWPTCSSKILTIDFSSPASVTIDSKSDFASLIKLPLQTLIILMLSL